jgi:hypothetical protein
MHLEGPKFPAKQPAAWRPCAWQCAAHAGPVHWHSQRLSAQDENTAPWAAQASVQCAQPPPFAASEAEAGAASPPTRGVAGAVTAFRVAPSSAVLAVNSPVHAVST